MEFIVSAEPKLYVVSPDNFNEISNKISMGYPLYPTEEELFLKSVITDARLIISHLLNINIKKDNMINCDLCQRVCGKLFEKYNVKVEPKTTHGIFSSDVVGHSFLVVTIGQSEYLIDINYRQFFTKEGCDVNSRLIMVGPTIVRNVDPGFFVEKIPSINSNTAKKIIEDGYILLTEETAKDYLDSFYYGKRGKDPYVNIPGEIYIKMIHNDVERYSSTPEMIKEYYGINYSERKN